MTLLYIAAGAVLGAPLRYLLQARVQDIAGPGFPWGTFAVNITGCLVFGFLATLAAERGALDREARLFLLTGFLGSYTTFSTFGWETVELLRDDRVIRAVAYVMLSCGTGVLAAWAGSLLARPA